MEDVIRTLYIGMKFERGAAEIREGKGVSNEEAKARLAKWLK